MENTEILNEFIKKMLISIKEELITEVVEKVIEKVALEKNNDKIYKAKEICEIFNISLATLNRWSKNGLKYTNTGKKTARFFTISDVNSYKKNNK